MRDVHVKEERSEHHHTPHNVLQREGLGEDEEGEHECERLACGDDQAHEERVGEGEEAQHAHHPPEPEEGECECVEVTLRVPSLQRHEGDGILELGGEEGDAHEKKEGAEGRDVERHLDGG